VWSVLTGIVDQDVNLWDVGILEDFLRCCADRGQAAEVESDRDYLDACINLLNLFDDLGELGWRAASENDCHGLALGKRRRARGADVARRRASDNDYRRSVSARTSRAATQLTLAARTDATIDLIGECRNDIDAGRVVVELSMGCHCRMGCERWVYKVQVRNGGPHPTPFYSALALMPTSLKDCGGTCQHCISIRVGQRFT